MILAFWHRALTVSRKRVIFSECDCLLILFQPIPDKEGKRCMFCVKTHNKTFEMSASDQRQKVEWTQGVLVCISSSIGLQIPLFCLYGKY